MSAIQQMVAGYGITRPGAVWTPQSGSGSAYWYSVASSADGTKLVAAERWSGTDGTGGPAGYIYTSTDSGVTWTQRTSAGRRWWQSIASSSDGTKLVAVARTYYAPQQDYIYTSTDSGVTWTQRATARTWYAVASSADGTKLVAVANDGLYTSTNSGVTWTEQSDFSGLRCVASSADGTKLVAASEGNIYTSTNSGVTWTARGLAIPWWAVASSADGTKLVAGVSGDYSNSYAGYVYTSTDSGVTWTQRSPVTASSFWAFAMSADGSQILACGGQYEQMDISYDYGASWSSVGPAMPWRGAASSADGKKLFAVAESASYIYTSP